MSLDEAVDWAAKFIEASLGYESYSNEAYAREAATAMNLLTGEAWVAEFKTFGKDPDAKPKWWVFKA